MVTHNGLDILQRNIIGFYRLKSVFEDFLGIITMKSANAGLISSIIENPPGRKPHTNLVRISNFYKSLDNNGKEIFKSALALAARDSMNTPLCVIDGSMAFEPRGRKGELELYYVAEGIRVRLNDPGETPLDELFRAED